MMISASDPLAWRPRIRREPDPRQADWFAAARTAHSHISLVPMTRFTLPAGAVQADLPERIPLQVVTSTTAPPDGKGWLHEIKHDGHRLVAIIADGAVRLLSRNARDRTELFAAPFEKLRAAGLPALMLDGEIAVPDDERGVTHIDALTEALRRRRPERLAYFAFDILHLDGHDLRRCRLRIARLSYPTLLPSQVVRASSASTT
jgi:bifunctional non-homologous end joining protein LigD